MQTTIAEHRLFQVCSGWNERKSSGTRLSQQGKSRKASTERPSVFIQHRTRRRVLVARLHRKPTRPQGTYRRTSATRQEYWLITRWPCSPMFFDSEYRPIWQARVGSVAGSELATAVA